MITKTVFLITISLQLDVVKLWYFKLQLFDLDKLQLWKSKDDFWSIPIFYNSLVIIFVQYCLYEVFNIMLFKNKRILYIPQQQQKGSKKDQNLKYKSQRQKLVFEDLNIRMVPNGSEWFIESVGLKKGMTPNKFYFFRY